MCFSVHFAKFSRTSILQNTSGKLLPAGTYPGAIKFNSWGIYWGSFPKKIHHE